MTFWFRFFSILLDVTKYSKLVHQSCHVYTAAHVRLGECFTSQQATIPTSSRHICAWLRSISV